MIELLQVCADRSGGTVVVVSILYRHAIIVGIDIHVSHLLHTAGTILRLSLFYVWVWKVGLLVINNALLDVIPVWL